MKARLAFLSIALCLCLLAGWGVSGVEKPLQEEAPPEESQATTFCRVVQEEQGTLLLAEQGFHRGVHSDAGGSGHDAGRHIL